MNLESKHITLSTHGLEIGYFSKGKKIPIVSNIDFELKKGSLVGLVGANGIGKSTLLRTLSGMQPKLEGKIAVNNKDLASFAPLELATQLSVVLTEAPASRNLSVLELVSLGRQPYTNSFGILSEEDKEVIEYALNISETMKLANRKCYELSDGQLQRAVIARALAQDTDIIILDEPTTHLDLYHRAYVLKLLKRLSAENGKTILFSTHEIDLAIQLADFMVVLDDSNTYVGEPCELIEAGRFDNLFPADTIHFDPKNGRFTIRN